MKLAARAPGKINLCLLLGPARPDGRHRLVTLLESVSLADELELTVDSGLAEDAVECPGVVGPNLAARALAALRAAGWNGPPVRIAIRKRVPVAGGMGGGSADAAATLRLASQVEPWPEGGRLMELAAGLGADVPSQLEPGLTLGTGAGEIVAPLAPLAAHAFVIVPGASPLSTAAVYREADRLGLPRAADELESLGGRLRDVLAPGATLPPELVVNELEAAAISLCPAIAPALAALHEAGADQVLVSGSGPTAAGLFWGHASRAQEVARSLGAGFPGTVAASPVSAEFGAVRRVD